MTTVAQRILAASLSLPPRGGQVEPLAIDDGHDDFGAYGMASDGMGIGGPVGFGVDDFGTTLFGNQSIDDLKQLMAVADLRMKAVAQAYANFAPRWVVANPAAMTDWTNDWTNLQRRYAAAVQAAQPALTATMGLGAFVSAQSAYDGILKAIKQSAPPDGGPRTKGDLDELSARLAAASGANVEPSNLPQPTTTDVDMAVFKVSGHVDPVSPLVGDTKMPLGLPNAPDIWAWAKKYKTWLIVGGVGLGGLIVLGVLAPYVSMASKAVGAAAKGVAAVL